MEGLQYQLELTIRRLVHAGWNPSHSPVWETNALKTLQLGQQVMSRINCTTMRLTTQRAKELQYTFYTRTCGLGTYSGRTR